MPRWGLTDEQLRVLKASGLRPWGLDLDLLSPSKVVTDPIHGDIYLSELERRILDSPPMQRLRRVRQLGTAHLVYPAATHTRFSHVLGALRVAQDLMDALLGHLDTPYAQRDLFQEWADQHSWKTAEATVLARVGALLHDLGHVPFGHSIEDDLQILDPHDRNGARFENLWAQLPDELTKADQSLSNELRWLILSKEEGAGRDHQVRHGRYPFVADVVGNTICADLMDYLGRDHAFTGLPFAAGKRFVEHFHVTPSDHPHFPRRMVIDLTHTGRLRTDTISEILKYLRYRYEESERVLTHHAKLAADAMIGKVLAMWRDHIWVDLVEEKFPEMIETLGRRDVDAVREALSKEAVEELDEQAKRQVEALFITSSDDGLLEEILKNASAGAARDKRLAAIAELTDAVLNRRLYKQLGRADNRALSVEVVERYGAPESRRRLEQEASRFAGLEHRWGVVLWIPRPEMRLKAAEVLVSSNGSVSPLTAMSGPKDRAREIYESHLDLWAVTAYAPRALQADEERALAALSKFQERLGLEFVDWRGEVVPKVDELAARHVAREKNLGLDELELLELELSSQRAAMGAQETFDELVSVARLLADKLK